MSTASATSESAARTNPTTGAIRWQYRPWERPWTASAPLLIAAVAVALVVADQTESYGMAAIVAAAVLAAGWRILTPATYDIGPIGIKVQLPWRRKRVAWRDIGRIEIGSKGLFLVPPGSVWGWWRGMYLPWLNHHDEVLAAVKRYYQRMPLAGESAGMAQTVAHTVSAVVNEQDDLPPPERLM